MKVAVYTLGCKVNQYETQEMICKLKQNGYSVTDIKDDADVYIINSCTVTAESSRKSRQAVRRLKKAHPGAVTVLTGCFPQAFPDEASLLYDADIVIGNKTNDELINKLNMYFSSHRAIRDVCKHEKGDLYRGEIIDSFDGHTRAFIKIQDGCNRYCTYCIIPKSRGFSRSKPLETVKEEIEALARNGYKELVFVGINLSAYGRDIGLNICDALETAENTPGIERIRLGSLEPDHITDDVISRMKKLEKFCPQFHLSLQSGCDKTLKRMNRHYTAEEYAELCKKLRENFTDASITTDIITGFPGETEDDFEQSVSFAKTIGFMKIHVFPFSPRKSTPAYDYPDKIENTIKEERCTRLQKEADIMRNAFMKGYIGRCVNVLFETPKNGLQQGYTENYTPVATKSETALTGQIRTVKITKINDDTCFGELV